MKESRGQIPKLGSGIIQRGSRGPQDTLGFTLTDPASHQSQVEMASSRKPSPPATLLIPAMGRQGGHLPPTQHPLR